MKFEQKKEIFDGVNINSLQHIKEASNYNHNYYIFKKHIILGISDDDNETEWFLIHNDTIRDLIGYSYVSCNPEKIMCSESMHT